MTTLLISQARWAIWFKWIVATALSPLIAWLIIWLLTMTLVSLLSLWGIFIGIAFSGIIMGASLGMTQSYVLKYRNDLTKPWALATTFGWASGVVLAFLVTRLLGAMRVEAFRLLIGSAVGLAMGIAQWLVLKKHSRQAIWWIVGSIVGWAAGIWISDAAGVLPMFDLLNPTAPSSPTGLIVEGAIAGAITGLPLVRLMPLPHGAG